MDLKRFFTRAAKIFVTQQTLIGINSVIDLDSPVGAIGTTAVGVGAGAVDNTVGATVAADGLNKAVNEVLKRL